MDYKWTMKNIKQISNYIKENKKRNLTLRNKNVYDTFADTTNECLLVSKR